MASSLSNIAAKDGAGATVAGGILAVDKSGATTGPFFAAQTIVDTQGVNTATVKAASTAVAAGDTAIAVGLHPTSPLPAGTNVIGHIILDSGTVTVVSAVTAITNPLPAGTNLLGKFGIDQTVPGTTNGVSITNANANGAAFSDNAAPVVQAPTSFRVAVTPTVTASAYTAGNVLGGIMTFANVLLPSPKSGPTKWSAVLESISVKFKAAAVTGEVDVAIFTASPAGGTYTDKTGPTWGAADTAKLVGIYSLPTPLSTLGTMTCYSLDGIGAAVDGASTSLFAVVTVKGTPTPASTSDVIVELGVLQG